MAFNGLVKPRARGLLALDETRLKEAGRQFYLSAGIDTDTLELPALRVS
ncbi:MAG: hypothetical protein QW057_02055 [Candidatus Bathyarchaeia archaeon]